MKIISKNKKAYHEYEILDKFEAGICLLGTEVKSLREGRVNFKDSYCKFLKGELYLTGTNISAYSHAKFFNHDPERERKLLMHSRELRRLQSKVSEKGLTIVPLMIYFNDKGLAKLEIGLAKGKNVSDKRDTERKKEIDREIQKNIKHH